MLKLVIIVCIIISTLIILTILNDKFDLFRNIKKKINDFFDVMKYKRQRNTAVNQFNATNAEYVETLKVIPTLVVKIENYENQIKDYKKEIKELKRVIEEDMTPKKKRGK